MGGLAEDIRYKMNLLIPTPVYIGEDVDDFEKLLEAERVSVELFVRFRMNSKADAKIFSHNHILS